MYSYMGINVMEQMSFQYGQHLRTLTDSALRLFLYLHDLARENPSFSMTLPVLAENARIPFVDVLPAQAELATSGLIDHTKSKITRVGEVDCNLRFTADKDKQLETLLQENEELRHRLRAYEDGTASGLADVLSPSHASVVHAAEDVLGRALTYEEVWYLGGLVAEYKSKRVRDTIYSQANAKNPLRATYAILRNGAKGKPFKNKDAEEFDPVEYVNLGELDDF